MHVKSINIAQRGLGFSRKLAPSKTWLQKAKQKLLWPFKKEALEGALEMIERHKSTFSLALTLDVHDAIGRIRIYLESMKEQEGTNYSQLVERLKIVDKIVQRNQEQTEAGEMDSVVSWLKAVDYRSNFLKNSERCPGTGEWFKNDKWYRDWVQPVPAAGAGKTVLLSSILDEFLPGAQYKGFSVVEPEITVLYYYFDVTEPQKRQTRSLITALLLQCISLRPGLSVLLSELRQMHGDATLAPMEELAAVLLRFLTEFRNTMLFLDAVDECLDLKKFFDTLGTLVRADILEKRLRTIATSRDETNIAQNMAAIGIDEVALVGSKVDSDIAIYIKNRLEVDADGQFKTFSEGLKDEVFKELTKNCLGMFRMAQCQLNEIAHKQSERKTYQWILDDMDDSDKEWAKRILLWLAGSVRPVTKGMLKEAIAIDLNSFEDDPPFDIDSIVGICRSLVSTQPTSPEIMGRSWANSPVISLAHATVKQFLDTPGALDFYLPSPWVQQTLAKACLAHATSPIFEKLQANWESDNSEPGLDYDLWDFLDYCITGFFEHLKASGTEQEGHLPFVLEKFRDPTSLGNYHANAEFVNKCCLQYPANERYPSYWFSHESEDGEIHEYLGLDHKSSILSKAFVYELPSLAWTLLVEGIDVHSLDASLWSPVSYFAAAGAVGFLKEVLRDKRLQDHNLKYESETYPREVLRQIIQPLGFGIIVAIGSRNSPSTDFLMNELRRCLGAPGAIGGKTSLQGRLLSLILALSATVGNESTARSLVHIVEGDETFTPRDKEEIFQQALYCAAKHGQKTCLLLLLDYVPTPAVAIPLWQVESLLYAGADNLIRSVNIRWAELCQEQLSLEVLEDDKLSVETPDMDDWEGNALLASVSAGKLEVARILVEHGMDPFLDGSAHRSAFSMVTSRASSNEGTCNQYWEFLLWLLDDEQPSKPIKPRQDYLDDTLCRCANMDEAAFWLDKGANPGKALISAVKFPRPEIVQLLLQKGADPNTKTNGLETPLIALLKDIRRTSSMEILRHLLDHGADPRLAIKTTLRAPKFSHYRGDGGVGSPLLGLARNCSPWGETEDLERVQGILEKLNAAHILDDINVYISSDNFGTPLIAAAAMGGTLTVDFLLEHGARCDVEGHSNVDWSFPALAATLAEYPAIAKMLLRREKYQSLSTKPESWAKCLILACSQEYDLSEWGDLIEILLEHGVDVNYHMDLTYGRHKKTDPTDKLRQFGCALVAACASGQLGLVQKLLQKGADEYPEHAGNHGSCLAAACASGDESLVDFFIGRGHDGNQLIRGVQYWCPLLAAAADGGYDAGVIVQRLLQNGANPDITYPAPNPKVSSSDIESLVMGKGKSWTSAFFHQRMWEDTMISGPSFDQADFFCGSPFIAAATHHSKDVLELLVENGVDVNKEVPGTYPTAYIATQLIFKKRWKIQNWLLEHEGSQPSPLQILRLNPAALGCITGSFFHSPPDLALPGSFWGNMLSIFMLSLPSTIPYFLKIGADPHAIVPGSFYGSVLLAAASLAQPAALRTLLEGGAQVNTIAEATTFGTPLIAACAGRVQFASQFLAKYDRTEIDDDDDRDEDNWAQNQLDVIKELLFWKADPNLTYGCFSPLLVLIFFCSQFFDETAPARTPFVLQVSAFSFALLPNSNSEVDFRVTEQNPDLIQHGLHDPWQLRGE
ncbi:hypothetical protein DL95DRAFT_414508 [Leptodontidium sp. 2 PMI_412]|nr:hypothetical protein DL95DRAFT_414508 [Leptodontidium sp. 2 PMI_412]